MGGPYQLTRPFLSLALCLNAWDASFILYPSQKEKLVVHYWAGCFLASAYALFIMDPRALKELAHVVHLLSWKSYSMDPRLVFRLESP